MITQEKIEYDKQHREELISIYQNYIKAFRTFIQNHYEFRRLTEWDSPQLGIIDSGFEVSDIFHFYYVLNVELHATLCLDGRYRIFFVDETSDWHSFSIYEYVSEEVYKTFYKNIAATDIEMPD